MFERSVQNNRFCFVEQAHQAGYLHSADYAILDQWYRWIRSNVDISLDLIGIKKYFFKYKGLLYCTFCSVS